MKLSGEQAAKTKRDNQRIQGFGKAWDKGTKLVVYFPIYEDENGKPQLLVAAEWMHSIDHKQIPWLRRIAIPSNAKTDEDNNILERDVMLRFSGLAKLLIDGEKEGRVRSMQEKKGITPAVLKKSLDAIEDEFSKKRAAVGPRTYKIATEVVAVELDENGTANPDKVGLYSMDISSERIDNVYKLMRDPMHPADPKKGYYEVRFTFGSSGERAQDGRVAPQGVTAEYALENKQKDVFDNFIATRLRSLPDDDTVIRKRNSTFMPMSEGEILSGISTYAVMASDHLETVPEELEDRLIRHSELLEEFHIELKRIDVAAEAQKQRDARAIPDAESLIRDKSEHYEPVALEGDDLNVEQDDDAEADLLKKLSEEAGE